MRRHLGVGWVLGLLPMLAFARCSDIESVPTFEPITDPAQLFMALTLNHGAINLSTAAPYDTLRLTATPRNALGEPLSGLPAPVFTSLDTTRVWVTPDGLLRARASGTGVRVVAEIVTSLNIRHSDTAVVDVTTNATPPRLTTFSITPESPEDAVWGTTAFYGLLGQAILEFAGVRVSPRLSLRALDENGAPISGLQVEYGTLDPAIVQIDRRTGQIVRLYAPGTARVWARTQAYGVTMADTAVFTVTMPAVHGFEFQLQPDSSLALSSRQVTVRPGGYVFWMNFTGKQTDIVFDDPESAEEIPEVCALLGEAHCGGGDIPAWDGSGGTFAGVRGRRFSTPGVYPFRSPLTGLTGRVIVTD